MAFPNSLDSFTNPSPGDVVASALIGQMADAVEALETKAGINGSTDPASLDYRANAALAGEAAHFGFKAWNWDLLDTGNAAATPTSGTLQLVRLIVPATTISNIHLAVGTPTAGTTQAFAALYTAAGGLLSQSANQSATIGTTGVKALPLAAPQAVSAGAVYCAFWIVWAGSGASFHRHGLLTNSADPRYNGTLAAPNLRFAVANTGLTNTAPASLGAMTATGSGNWWVAVS